MIQIGLSRLTDLTDGTDWTDKIVCHKSSADCEIFQKFFIERFVVDDH